MCVYAVVSRLRLWFTGVRHINLRVLIIITLIGFARRQPVRVIVDCII